MSEMLLLVTGLVVGVTAGVVTTWLIINGKLRDSLEQLREAERELYSAEGQIIVQEKQAKRDEYELEQCRTELRRVERERTSSETQLREARKSLNDQQLLVDKAKRDLTILFQTVAQQSLTNSQKDFLTLADNKFQALKAESTSELEHRKQAVASLVAPIATSLEAFKKATQSLEEKRQKDMGSLDQQLKNVATAQHQLQQETGRLVQALKSPQVRGRWGEVALRRTAELAGMSQYCDFCEQVAVETSEGRQRPDMIVNLPSDRQVIVDSKVPLSGFMEALEALTEESRKVAFVKHSKQVLSHVNLLAAKEYWSQFGSSPEFVVLFIPNDSFLAAAAEHDPELVEYALSKKIVLATPTTFVALLRTVEFSWQQRKSVENATHIRNLGQEMSDRFAVLVDHLGKIGSSLTGAVKAFNSAVTSYESRLLPAARRFRELGAGGRRDIEEVAIVDETVRSVEAAV